MIAVRMRWLAVRAAGLLLMSTVPAAAQIDEPRAAIYFHEAAALCEREAGRLWNVSLCGPIVFADPVSHALSTNRPRPAAAPPAGLGFANAAIDWGGERWTALVWPWIPADERERARLLAHELFHRVQPQLGLFVDDGRNDHLDTLDGRYWLQLEWRALARALAESGADRRAAIADALAFRRERRRGIPGAADNERRLEINEGLAQYTGTAAAAASEAQAIADAIEQLAQAVARPTFVRSFAYASGPAYGLLLDASVPGWRQRITSGDDLGALLAAAVRVAPADDAVAAASRYDGPRLRTTEEAREVQRVAQVAALRRRFVDGPVLTLPAARTFTFSPNGVTPLSDAGTVYLAYAATAEWGRLEASTVLISVDRATIAVPAPAGPITDARIVRGDGWTLQVADGWIVGPGRRSGDLRLSRKETPDPIR